ncbi:1-phosphofructokinase, partial [Staphylococcus aureus]
NKDGAVTANTPVGKLVNSVGAGDSLVAGFVANVKEKVNKKHFDTRSRQEAHLLYTFGLCSNRTTMN